MTDEALAAAFAHLGLAADADARAVRQAYARQLKQIDQATQIEAFQALRAAYELVLAAVQRGGPLEAPPAPAIPAAVAADDAPWDDFIARLPGLDSTEDAAALLQHTLVQLTHLEAGSRFEQKVALLLARGWQPGHEFLLDAASDAFHWEQDRRHLATLGNAGQALQEALIQGQAFLDQPADVLERHRRLVRRLRDATPPTPTLLRDEKLHVQILVRRFPHWLPVVTSGANVEHWLGGPQALQAVLETSQPGRPVEAPERPISDWQVLLFLLWLAFMAWRHFG